MTPILLALVLLPSAAGGPGATMEREDFRMRAPLSIGAVTGDDTVGRGAKLELTFALAATYDNPFDPDDVRVNCEITGPDGAPVTVPAFLYVPFEVNADGTTGARGEPVWKVRFAPSREGDYAYRITARDRTGQAESPVGTFRCVAGEGRGFVRVAEGNPLAFEFADGTPFHAIGLNLLGEWATPNNAPPPAHITEKLALLERLADAGGTFIRLRAEGGYLPIEGPYKEGTGFLGAGWYHAATSHGIDRLYAAAERRGIQSMHCLEEGLILGVDRSDWYAGVYNWSLAANGGPCEEPTDFWTNEEARRLVRNKLRYSVARWGYSSSLMAWEFFNETRGNDDPAVVGWHGEMARYLREIDPYDHPITTSSLGAGGELWRVRELDFVQKHIYGATDVPLAAQRMADQAARETGKPMLLGEFGAHAFNRGWRQRDPDGLAMHNVIWGGAMAGTTGAADWFVRHIAENDLFRHYRAFADWAADVPWNHPDMRALDVGAVVVLPTGDASAFYDMLITGQSTDLYSKSPAERFAIDPVTREISNLEHLQPHVHAMESRKTTPTFVLDCAAAAQFRVYVAESVGNAENALRVYVDGALVAEESFPAAEGEGDRAREQAQWDNWTVEYDTPRVVSVDIPAGRHEVMVEALGKDRLGVFYALTGYATTPEPCRVLGRRTDDAAWLWVQSMASSMGRLMAGMGGAGEQTVTVALAGLAEGDYDVEWYDCWAGKVIGSSEASSRDGKMTVRTPPFARDVAAKVARTK